MYYFITEFQSQEIGGFRIAIFADEDENSELRKNFKFCDDFNTLKCVYKNSLEEMVKRNWKLSDPCFNVFNKPLKLTDNEIMDLYSIFDNFSNAMKSNISNVS
jgi:hypothetical protein